MRFLLVMLALAASMPPLVACEATKTGQKDASPSDGTKDLTQDLTAAATQPTASRAAPSDAVGSDAVGVDAVGVDAVGLASPGSRVTGSGVALEPAETTGTSPAPAHAEGPDGIAARGKHSPALIEEGRLEEGRLEEGNGEPMDDVDDEEVPATDKSGVDHPPTVEEESEGTGIKLQE